MIVVDTNVLAYLFLPGDKSGEVKEVRKLFDRPKNGGKE